MTDFQFWLLSTFSVFLCNILSLSRFIPKRTKVVDAAAHIDITYHFCPKLTKSVEIATIFVKTTISVAVANHFCSIWTKSVDEQNRCLQPCQSLSEKYTLYINATAAKYKFKIFLHALYLLDIPVMILSFRTCRSWQTVQTQTRTGSSPFTVCYSICIFLTKYPKVWSLCLNLR